MAVRPFRPADPTALGIIRLVAGVLGGIVLIGNRDGVPAPVLGIGLGIVAAHTVGMFSRVSAVLVAFVLSFAAADEILHGRGLAHLAGFWTLVLAATGTSGQAVALDRFLSRWRAFRRALARRPEGPWTPPPGRPGPTVEAAVALGLLRLHALVLIVAVPCGFPWRLGLFALAVVSPAMVPGRRLRRLVTGRSEEQPAGQLLYDGACPVCRASMALVMAADPDHIVAPVDLNAVDVAAVHPSLTRAACLEAMHLVARDGRVWRGYDAVVRLGRWLPLFWPLGGIGSLPGMAGPGRLLYNRIASRRRREGPCSDATCSLHPPSRFADRVPPGPLEPQP